MSNGDAQDRPVVIFHISDLHFGAEDAEKITALRNEIQRCKPDVFCITGDIVNFPRKKNFLKAKDFIDELEKYGKVFVVPGNHDAFFGRFGISRFRKHLGRDVEFEQYVRIRGKDICLIGVNSTSGSLRHLQNTGRMTRPRIKRFGESVARLKARPELGEYGYRNAYKIVLLHHHPLPTVTSEAEAMVYLQKAGYFLTEMSNQGIDIILHGHQHDPCDFSINYNVGGDSDWMIVLSAGTTLKRKTELLLPESENQEVSAKTHFYMLTLYNDIIDIQGMNYHLKRKEFVPGKGSTKRLAVDPLAKYEVELTYTIKPLGNLLEEGSAVYKTKPGRTVAESFLSFGVDQATPGATLEQCNLEVFREGQKVDPKHLTVEIDGPREKRVKVTLDPPIGTNVETVSWRYEWPKGWDNLIQRGIDSGNYYFRRRTNKLQLKIVNQYPSLAIRSFDCTAYNGAGLTKIGGVGTPTVGFVMIEPRKYYTVSFVIGLN
jgi:predicted MPP superfamily phosphohydrolase